MAELTAPGQGMMSGYTDEYGAPMYVGAAPAAPATPVDYSSMPEWLVPSNQGFANGYTDEYGAPVYFGAGPAAPSASVNPWDQWFRDMTPEGVATFSTMWDSATPRMLVNELGLDPASSLASFQAGMANRAGFDQFAGAQDTNNMALQPGWGMYQMLSDAGMLNPQSLAWLQQYVDQGNQRKDAYNAMQGAKSKAALGQFLGMLGSVAFSPMAFGGAEYLGQLGGRLAGGAAGAIGSAIGGGNPLTSIIGAATGPLADALGGTAGMFESLGPAGAKVADSVVRSLGTGALQQIATGRGLDPTALALGAIPGAADAVWEGAGGWDGLFGSNASGAQSWTSGYDLPMGQIAPIADSMRVFGSDMPETPGMMPVSWSPERQQLDSLFPQPTNINDVASVVPGSQTAIADALFPVRTAYETSAYAPAAIGRSSQMSPTPERQQLDELFPPPAEPATSENLFTPDEGMMSQAPDEKAWYDDVKPGTIIRTAMRVLAMLGGSKAVNDAMVGEADAIVNATYRTEAERRQAYLDYANRVFASIPEIADAYTPDFFAENSSMGRVEIDPATGEARYIITPEGQKSLDGMMNAADRAIDQILETDTSKLSETEFQKKVEALRGKRDADLAKLMRIMYARGMLGLATYQTGFTNPLTGRMEGYQLGEGQEANPYLAAYQAGVERENAELASKSLNDAQDFIDSLVANGTGSMEGLGRASTNMIDAILGARSRYDARNAGEQERGNALAQLLQSPAGLFGDRVTEADLLAAEGATADSERRRMLEMMGGM